MKIAIAYSSSKEREVRLIRAFPVGLLTRNSLPEALDPNLELKTELLPTWTHGGTEAKKALIHGQNHDRKNNERRKDEKL